MWQVVQKVFRNEWDVDVQVQKRYWTTLYLKQQWKNLIVKSNSSLSGFISYCDICVEWIRGFIQEVGVPVLILSDCW